MEGLNINKILLTLLISLIALNQAEGSLITELSVRNTQDIARVEYANSAVPIAEGLTNSTQGFYVTDAQGTILPAQFSVAARWGTTQADISGSIKFLNVLFLVELDAAQEQIFHLHYESDITSSPQALLQTTDAENQYVFETDALTVQINTASAGLISSFDFNDNLSSNSEIPYSGPYLVQSGQQFNAVQTSVVIEENGHLSAVLKAEGEFPGSGLYCGGEDLSYTSRFIFHKDVEQIEIAFDLHNTNGDPELNGVNSQFACTVEEAGWLFPVSANATDELVKMSNGTNVYRGQSGTISQHRGSSVYSEWRNATIVVDSTVTQQDTYFATPSLGISRGEDTIVATIPWMRNREPQAITADQSGLKIQFISDSTTLAEAQTRWGQAKIGFVSVTDDGQFMQSAAQLVASQEHGLLILAAPDYTNTTKVFPRLPTAWQSAGAQLAQWQVSLVINTVDAGGQFDRIKNFGMSWPDYSYNQPWSDFDTPGQFTTGTNYWSESSNIAAYTLATQEPEAFWKLAYPLEKTFLQTIVYNKRQYAQPNIFGKSGLIRAGNQAGDEVAGGMFRSGYNSQDYLYNQGSALVGAILKPDNALIDVFARACQTMLTRYGPDTPQQLYVNQRRLSRYAVQHINMLRYSSQFVKDSALANQCAALYHDIMQDLAEGPLSKGMFCSGTDAPETTCETDQGFMFFALHQDLFVDYILDNQNTRPEVVQQFKKAMQNYAREGINNLVQLTDSGDVSPTGNIMRNTRLSCTFDATQLQGCTGVPYDVLQAESAGQLTSFVIADFISKDATQQICERGRDALLPAIRSGASYIGLGAWKGAAQFRRNLIFGAGITENCSDIDSQAINGNILSEPYPQDPLLTEPGTPPGENTPPADPVEPGNPPADPAPSNPTGFRQIDFASLAEQAGLTHNLHNDDLHVLSNGMTAARFDGTQFLNQSLETGVSLQQGQVSFYIQASWLTQNWSPARRTLFNIGASDNIPAIRLTHADGRFAFVIADHQWNQFRLVTPRVAFWEPNEIVHIQVAWDGTGSSSFNMLLSINGQEFTNNIDSDIALLSDQFRPASISFGSLRNGQNSADAMLANLRYRFGQIPELEEPYLENEEVPSDVQVDFSDIDAVLDLDTNLEPADAGTTSDNETGMYFSDGRFLNFPAEPEWDLASGSVSITLQPDWLSHRWSANRRTLFNLGSQHNVPSLRLEHADSRIRFTISDKNWQRFTVFSSTDPLWQAGTVVNITLNWDLKPNGERMIEMLINDHRFVSESLSSVALNGSDLGYPYLNIGSNPQGQRSAAALLTEFSATFGQ